jgi:hypothetical protein
MYGDDFEKQLIVLKNENIPTIILRSWGNLTPEKYQSLRKNPTWLKCTTKVCVGCYMNLTKM